MVKIHFKRSTKTPVTSTSNSTAAAAAAATTIVATPDIKTNTNRDNENQQTTSATPTTTTSNQEQNEHSQHQHQHQQNQSNQATNFFLHTRNRGDLRATLYGLYGDSKKSSKAAAKQSNSATISSSGHKTSQHQSSSTSRIIKPTPSMNAAGTTARPSTRTIMKNSSDKTVISTPLPPYEIEVTEVDGKYYIECPLCVLIVNFDTTPDLQTCDHRTCLECMQNYLKTEINHSRLNITCPICSEPMLQNVIRDILKDEKFYAKYESFMLRKVLAAEPDARWCPAPDCGYAVLANGCASCPRLVCERKSCNTAFCYHCKQEWHPNQTCSSASIQRNKRNSVLDALNIGLAEDSNQTDATNDGNGEGQQTARKSSKSSQQTASLKPDDIKECPVCSSRIIKMNDGSCNHMTCSICETEFCWLCMKEINDLHYFSPSGCTFWGKKPWSRKKKLLWRLGMLVGAPICIIFIAGIAVPAIVIGIPVWAARKLHTRLERKQFSRYRKNAIITGGVLLSFVVSPIISAMALAIGVPILLGYVYGVVPLSLCRSSGGCLSSSPSIANIPQQYQPSQARGTNNLQATDVISIDTATSHKLGNPSIGETSMYMSNLSLETNSIGHVTSVGREDRESASNAALAGSIMGANTDDGSSTRALAGSIISKESGGYALIPAEIHNQQQRQASTVSH